MIKNQLLKLSFTYTHAMANVVNLIAIFIEKPFIWMDTHICRSLCILLLFLYMFLCIVSCFMHSYDRTLVNFNSLIQCLVSINSSSDDLIQSVYYISTPIQHISGLKIFNNLYINFQSSLYANYHAWRQRVIKYPSKSSSHHRLFDSPEVWPL